MVFVTVGTHEQQFDRLVRAADDYAATSGEEVFVQIGYSTYEPSHYEWSRLVPFEEMRERMEQADVSDFDLVRRERDGGFSKEMSEETARCDAIARESFEGGVWQTLRETHKLFYDRVIERYERAQKAGTADE